jgi:hypothetical protein
MSDLYDLKYHGTSMTMILNLTRHVLGDAVKQAPQKENPLWIAFTIAESCSPAGNAVTGMPQ